MECDAERLRYSIEWLRRHKRRVRRLAKSAGELLGSVGGGARHLEAQLHSSAYAMDGNQFLVGRIRAVFSGALHVADDIRQLERAIVSLESLVRMNRDLAAPAVDKERLERVTASPAREPREDAAAFGARSIREAREALAALKKEQGRALPT